MRIIKWLQATGKVNVDCASPSEMRLCLDAGFNSDQIIYANTMKSINDIEEVPGLGIGLTTVDSVEGVEQIAAVSDTDAIWSPDILVRLAVDDSEAKSPFSIKFGSTESEWKKIIDAINFYKLPFKGVSFHVGSGSASPGAFRKAIKKCWHFQEHVECGPMHTVDIGGGFLHDEESFAGVAGAINEEIVGWPGKKPTRWIAEPGRFFSNPVQTLFTPIVFSKENDESYRYILDDSIYGNFNSILFDHSKPAWVVLDSDMNPINREETEKTAMFFGKTCDSMDFIAMQRNSPKYEVGDVFVFPNMGAYTSATATEFNGFELPRKVYDEDGLIENFSVRANPSVMHPISVKSDVKLSREV